MPYNPQKDAVVVSKPFGAIGFPIDSRSFFYDEANFVRRAFISTAEVLAYFDTPFKREGMFYVFVNSTGTLQPNGTILGGTRVAYWWKEGTADNQLIVVVAKGDKGDKGEAFTYADFTPEQIEELQQPAIDAAVIANTAALNANDKATLAQNATTLANTATTNANNATTAANTATTNANTATTQANTARDSANAAAIVANSARGWQPEYGLESDGATREVQKLIRWVGGTGSTPIDYVGKYIGSTGFVDTKAEATNVKGNTGAQGDKGDKGDTGAQGVPGTTTTAGANSVLGNDTGVESTPKSLTPVGLTLKDSKLYNSLEIERIAIRSNVALLYVNSDSVGSIKINIPSSSLVGTVMYLFQGTIGFYDFTSSSNRTCTFTIGCYNYVSGEGITATFYGANAPKFPVKFFQNVDGQECYITIGELTQGWSYLGVSIDTVQARYSVVDLQNALTDIELSLITENTLTQRAELLETRPQFNPNQILSEYNAASGVNTPLTNAMSPTQMFQNLQKQNSNRYTKAESQQLVDGIMIGGRNYQPNSEIRTLTGFTTAGNSPTLVIENVNELRISGINASYIFSPNFIEPIPSNNRYWSGI